MSRSLKHLFTELKPEHYALQLIPDREAQTFSGIVEITAQKKGRPSKRITLHQKGLTITKARISHHAKSVERDILVDRINNHNSFDEVRLHTTELLYPGNYSITLEFTGTITKAMNGMYPCNFEHDGKTKQLIATQFESHHAREVFPCVDEPAAKATFDLTLTTPKGETVISNTPVKSQKTSGNSTITSFERTPIMSTYLLAYVYGEMGYKEAKTKNGVTVRAYATPDNVQFTDFALDVAVRCLDFYNDYFKIPYPLEKCDMIALPDFASGAMENWGCITYREQCMLVDPKNTSIPTKQYVAMVVAHELAHQWFGNLVTMSWWTDLWLNEGFASWIEYLAIDDLFPQWQMWTQFAVDEQHRAFKLDALEHTHPVEVPINHPDEIRSIFDTISYSKGASVIHMLHAYLGAEDFQKGLQLYLSQHAYGNTTTVDLWKALEKASKKPVRTFMHAWTSQDGFPIVNVQVTDNQIDFHQKRFYINPLVEKKDKSLWPIALQATDKSAPLLMDGSKLTIETKTPNTFTLNESQTGFYRVLYDADHTKRIAKLIEQSKISALDRLGLLSDVFECAKSGLVSTTQALTLLDSYRSEDNSAVWDVIAASIGSIRGIMDDEDLRTAMEPYIIRLTNEQVKRLSWDPKNNDSYFDLLLRPTIFGMSAVANEPQTVKKALSLFETMSKPEDVHPDMRSIVFNTAVRKLNDKSTFDKLFTMHEASSLSEERTTLAAALTGFKDKSLYNRALSLITTSSVRHQDVSYWVVYSFMNRFARNATWDWMKSNWKWLEENLGSDLSFSRFPLYAANSHSDESFIDEYQAFFNKHSSPGMKRSIDQGLETLQWQSAWKKRDKTAVKTYFKQYN